MQNIVPLSYDYVFSLAQQLSPEEQEMLARGIISHPTANKTKTTNILPSLNKEEMAARKQRLLEKALKCPILSEEELFEKGHFPWTGTTNVGSYCVSAAPSHYEWAMKKIKQYAKGRKP